MTNVPVDNGEFSERSFFLRAFQNIYLTFVLSQASDITSHTLATFQQILLELGKQHATNGHGGRCLILFQDSPAFVQKLKPLFASMTTTLLHLQPEDHFFQEQAGSYRIPTILWQACMQSGQPSLMVAGVGAESLQTFEKKIIEISLILRMSRLVWVDGGGGITDTNGRLIAFFNGSRLSDIVRREKMLTSDPKWQLLKNFRSLLIGGVKAISLCRLADLEQELFTYQGCGSFFSQQSYCHVRRLGLDDFERAVNIIRRGEQDGFLLSRSEKEVSEVLVSSYGAFILEGHLAGLCGLHTADYHAEKAGEIVALYTLTRFQGSGVGVQLLRYLVRDAKRLGLHYLFACTRHERVVNFFVHPRFNRHRNRFQRVGADQIPSRKWQGYDLKRKKQVVCLRLNLLDNRSLEV